MGQTTQFIELTDLYLYGKEKAVALKLIFVSKIIEYILRTENQNDYSDIYLASTLATLSWQTVQVSW